MTNEQAVSIYLTVDRIDHIQKFLNRLKSEGNINTEYKLTVEYDEDLPFKLNTDSIEIHQDTVDIIVEKLKKELERLKKSLESMDIVYKDVSDNG